MKNDLYRLVVENAMDAFFLHGLDGQFMEVNAQACRSLGYSREDCLKLSIKDVSQNYNPDGIRAVLDRARATGTVTLEDVHIRKDGSVFPVEVRIGVVDEGEEILLLSLARDISDQKRAEEHLQTSEANYQALFEAEPDPIVVVDQATGRIVDANPSASHLYGYTHDELCALPAVALSAEPDQSQAHIAAISWEAQGGPVAPIGYRRHRKKDGTEFPVEIAHGFYIQGGRKLICAIFRDITERKQAEQERERLLSEVQRRAAELDAVIESIPDGVVIYGPGAKIIRMNSAAEKILGYTPEEQELPFPARVALLRAETAEGIPLTAENAPFVKALDEETVHNVVAVLHPPRGESVWISFSAAPILDSAGTLMGAVGIFTDVTALHELQEQREDFLRAVSHDMGTPLVCIGGFAHLLLRQLEESGADEKQLKYLSFILTDTKRMKTMIRDLVDSVRLEAGQLPVETEPVSLAAFVSDWLSRAAGAMEVACIQVRIPVELPPVWADPNRLDRVLTNLLTNALKYSEPETAVVIAAEQTGKEATISITDRGTGIDPGDLPHIFERFYRVPGARKTESVGLGLYITKMLVEAMGGRIWAESEPGRGSTFHFSLPLA